ncbi:uncharacterized protein T551_03106 [Pneumocystis jirovecii RU7]|uniref:Major surface glycoprotein 2 C-terminal domain-containing protein n=1 Tax=Pneumocystis jirovecii (strain RU7) TaxID=1408657 RepID=A0A0W4ZGV8_PNEJ7|nr:uncharacterized protein T551_03106 [Pneumocystis jirovecii RU7]KTW27607.1 hypothetical protein T551_03106 [Pneumocystis jirovecii RU7]
MKAFVLANFLGMTYAFSENIESIYKEFLNLLQNPPQNLLQNPSQNPLSYITKENIFALILKDTTNNQCQIKLKKYCKDLEEKAQMLESSFNVLKELCQETELNKKCNDLEENIMERCTALERSLKDILTKPSKTVLYCLYQNECMFVQEACSMEVKEKCNYLRIFCRGERRDDLKTKFLLRALSGNLKTKEDCEKIIDKKCLAFMEESDELMNFCLIPFNKCDELIKLMKRECSSLQFSLKKLLGNTKISKEECNLLLEECYFHNSNCNNTLNDECREIEKKCENEVKYKHFPLPFNPIGKEIVLIEKIGKEKLFKDEIGKPGIKDTIDLLILLSNGYLSVCETYIEECRKLCSLLPQLEDLYNNTKRKMNKSKEICTTLEKKLKPKCKFFKSKLYDLSLSDTNEDNKDAKLIGWTKQSINFNEKLCIDLESKCFYLRKSCNNVGIKMFNACINVKSTCLKTRLFRREYQLFQSTLKGKLHNLTNNSLKTCIDELWTLCKKIISNDNPILMDLCLHPWNTCKELANDIERQSRWLRSDLDWKRDFPDEEDCKKLKEKCEVLGHDSKMNDLPCFTLKGRCDHLKNAKELEDILLEEKAENLGNLDICIERVSEKCNKWSKRKKTRFIFSCIQLVTTCQIITRDIKSKCSVLEKNIDIEDVLNQVKSDNANIKGPTCDLWEPYCDKFMLSCEILVQNNGKNGKCKELKESCKSYREIQEQEVRLMYELRGSLNDKNKCESTLNKHCLHWDKTKNNTFKNFCNNNTGTKNNTTKSELCKKLLKHVKERCTKLLTKLNDMATEIEKSIKIVEELNEAAKKALKNTNLILTSSKQKTDPNINNATLILAYNANADRNVNLKTDVTLKNQSRYLEQKETKVNITEKEVEAFDAAAEALKVYTEVKAECKGLQLECEFKEDCSEYKDVCKKIEDACNKLKSLEIKSSETKTINQTIKTIITKTETNTTQKTLTTGEQCMSISTTDKWITRTSTHTHTSTQTSVLTLTVTLTSTKECKPMKCTTGSEEEAGDVKSSKGLRMNGWGLIKGVILTMIISTMI